MGKRIAETNQERRRLEALLGRTPTTKLTAEDVKALVASLQDINANSMRRRLAGKPDGGDTLC